MELKFSSFNVLEGVEWGDETLDGLLTYAFLIIPKDDKIIEFSADVNPVVQELGRSDEIRPNVFLRQESYLLFTRPGANVYSKVSWWRGGRMVNPQTLKKFSDSEVSEWMDIWGEPASFSKIKKGLIINCEACFKKPARFRAGGELSGSVPELKEILVNEYKGEKRDYHFCEDHVYSVVKHENFRLTSGEIHVLDLPLRHHLADNIVIHERNPFGYTQMHLGKR